MNLDPRQLDRLLDRVAAGELDSLAPAEIEALAQRLDGDPEFAARLGDARPPHDSRFQTPPAGPRPAEWDAMFAAVTAAGSSGDSQERGRAPAGPAMRILRPWWRYGSRFAAVAACVLVAFTLWRFAGESLAPAGDDWAVNLSDDVEVLELETDADYSSFVSYQPDGGASMIWIFKDDESQEASS